MAFQAPACKLSNEALYTSEGYETHFPLRHVLDTQTMRTPFTTLRQSGHLRLSWPQIRAAIFGTELSTLKLHNQNTALESRYEHTKHQHHNLPSHHFETIKLLSKEPFRPLQSCCPNFLCHLCHSFVKHPFFSECQMGPKDANANTSHVISCPLGSPERSWPQLLAANGTVSCPPRLVDGFSWGAGWFGLAGVVSHGCLPSCFSSERF